MRKYAATCLVGVTLFVALVSDVVAQPSAVPIEPAAVPTSVELAPDTVVDGIQRFYSVSKDLRARFRQTYTYKAYKRTQVSTGRVFFKKPGRMRWDYVTPVAKLFVSDGDTLWVYEPEESQAFKRSLRSAQLPVALTFMTGEGDLSTAFDASLVESEPSEGTVTVELVPKSDEGDYKALRLKVDRTTFQVKASTVIDPVGNTNHVEFDDVEINLGLPDEGFAFNPPAGVRVISEPGARRPPQ